MQAKDNVDSYTFQLYDAFRKSLKMETIELKRIN